jgi:PIN domain nuclease of toxin-antitoxin system
VVRGLGSRGRRTLKLLLDTQIVIWQQEGKARRIGRGVEAIKDAEELLVSTVSFLEIGIKASIGKLRLPDDLREQVLDSGARILSLDAEHGLTVGRLPLHHRDPFDRALISQAKAERLTILTSDAEFEAYDVPVVLAGP